MKPFIIVPPALLLFLQSCGIYQSHFECPASPGVRCVPVSTLLEHIVEQEEGDDLFLPPSAQAKPCCSSCLHTQSKS